MKCTYLYNNDVRAFYRQTNCIIIFSYKNLVQIRVLCFWTLSNVLSVSKNTVLFIFQNTKFQRLDSVPRLQFQTGRWIMSRNIIFVLMYHRHKLLDLNYNSLRLLSHCLENNYFCIILEKC
jgi:hypothetical protein